MNVQSEIKFAMAMPRAARRITQPKKTPVLWKVFFISTGALAVCFSFPLYQLLRLAFNSELYSYVPLIPLVSAYFIWQQRKNFPQLSQPARAVAAYFIAIGLAAPLFYCMKDTPTSPTDFLSVTIFAFVSFIAGAAALCLGKEIFCAMVFPLCLLVFMVPMPDPLRQSTETFLQAGSAAVANGFFTLARTPFFQDGLNFQLPGINLHVAPECSGMHSSLVLFITAFIAAKLFLRRPWMRTLLVLATIPLALLRNGFRIFVIGELCVRHGAEMLNSPIHRHGGPLFFILSLPPLFGLLLLLRNRERQLAQSVEPVSSKSL